MKAQESKSSFAKMEYQLELAAANRRYEMFRDGQCPEVMQVVNAALVDTLQRLAQQTADTMQESIEATVKGEATIKQLVDLISVDEELETFQRAHPTLFPEEHLFPIDSAAGAAKATDGSLLSLAATKDTQTMLLQTRAHLGIAEEKHRKELDALEEQMTALRSLCEVGYDPAAAAHSAAVLHWM